MLSIFTLTIATLLVISSVVRRTLRARNLFMKVKKRFLTSFEMTFLNFLDTSTRVGLPFLFFAASLFQLTLEPISAQPANDELRILRIDTTNYPTIRIYLRVLCNGNQIQSINKADLYIQDNDISRTFTLSCPTETKPISVALALDRSGSVAGTSIIMIKEGAKQFYSLFKSHNSGTDEGALISFADDVTLDQEMTTDKQALINAVDNLIPLGYTRLWDGALVAIQHVIDSAKNQLKAVILLTDGYDNLSTATRSDVIRKALDWNIPVYTIGVTYEDTSYAVRDLKYVADSTGGNFFPVYEPKNIVEAYNAIASIITGGDNDCMAEYQVECADGSVRTVVATAVACGTTVTKTQTYRSRIDKTLPAFSLSVGNATAYTNSRVRIPVFISSGGGGTNITDLRFQITGHPLITFSDIISSQYFAKTLTLDHWYTSAAVFFHLFGSSYLSGTDTLLIVEYDVGNVQRDSTILLPLLNFTKKIDGCQIQKTIDGSLKILIRPVLAIQCQDSIRVKWDDVNGNYNPPLITLSVTSRNTGIAPAKNVSARIILPYGLELAQGSDKILLSPSTLQTNQTASGQFQLKIVPSDSVRTLPVCIETFADSSIISKCCTQIFLAAGRPKLKAICSAVTDVKWDDLLRDFVPNPFTISMDVTNLSVLTAQNITAWIHAPQEFVVDVTTPILQTIIPSTLKTSQTGHVEWLLRALERPTSDTVEFCMKATAGNDTVVCCVKVYVTASPVRIAMLCSVPKSIIFNEENNQYEPTQFEIGTMIRNTSFLPMTQVQARLSFSDSFGLANGETAVKYPPGQIIQAGDSVILKWNAIGARVPTTDSAIACITITADNFPGTQCCSPLYIIRKNSAPVLSCAMQAPDTVRFIETAYTPNPITLKLVVSNIGTSPAKNVYAALLQGADLSIDSNDVSLKLVADSLASGDRRDIDFRIKILPRFISRTDTIRISIYTQNGGAIVCEKYIFIEAVKNPSLALICTAPDSLVFNDSLNDYFPSPIVLNLTVRNIGTADAKNVTAEFLNASGLILAQNESAVKSVLPSLLRVSDQGVVSWFVRAIPHTVSSLDSMRVRVTADGGFSGTTSLCISQMTILPVRKPSYNIQCKLAAQLQVVEDKYQPDPLPVDVIIENTGNANGYDLSISLLNGTAFIISSQDTALKKRSPLHINQKLSLRWLIHALSSSKADTSQICFQLTDRFGNTANCCAQLIIPPITTAKLQVTCSTVDTLYPNPVSGEYNNPFTLETLIKNISSVTIDSVRMIVVLPPDITIGANDTIDKNVYAISSQTSSQVQWKLNAQPDTSQSPRLRIIRIVYYSSSGVMSCERIIVLMPGGQAQTTVTCFAPDSIKYVNATVGLQPSPFSISIQIKNTGRVTLTNSLVTLQLPPELSLVSGEQLTKYISQSIGLNSTASVSWNVIPSLSTTERAVQCIFLIQTAQTSEQICTTRTIIEAIKQEVQLRIPEGNIVGVGQKINVPVYYSSSSSVSITSFDFAIEFNQRLISITGTNQEAVLTSSWQPIQMTILAPGVTQFTSSGTLPINKDGILCYLTINGISGDGIDDAFGIAKSPLRFQRAAVQSGVVVNTADGDVTTAGVCVPPLKASDRYVLMQNQPNPFNPTTIIIFNIPFSKGAQDVVLTVIDQFGRKVATLVNGTIDAGLHSVRFDGSTLPSGMYFYQLMTKDFVDVKKMILAR